MAGTKTGEFKELISPFLKSKIASAAQQFGPHSRELRALTRQYVKDPLEDVVQPNERRRHYESEATFSFEGRPLVGVERLYRRTVLIEPSTVCAAHCRWCLRGQYPIKTMKEDDIVHAARYFGSPEQSDDLNELRFCVLPLIHDHQCPCPIDPMDHRIENITDLISKCDSAVEVDERLF